MRPGKRRDAARHRLDNWNGAASTCPGKRLEESSRAEVSLPTDSLDSPQRRDYTEEVPAIIVQGNSPREAKTGMTRRSMVRVLPGLVELEKEAFSPTQSDCPTTPAHVLTKLSRSRQHAYMSSRVTLTCSRPDAARKSLRSKQLSLLNPCRSPARVTL